MEKANENFAESHDDLRFGMSDGLLRTGTMSEALEINRVTAERDELKRHCCNLELENRDLRERLENWENWKEGLPRLLCDIAEAQEELEPEYVRVLETALFEMPAGSRDLAMAISNVRELMSDVSACISEAVKLSTAPAERSGS